jgi:predicted nucleic-acid-binding protein
MSAFIDTNVLVRHLTGDPPDLAERSTRFLGAAGVGELRLVDLVFAEVVYVLQSFYKVPREQVAESARAIVAFPAIRMDDPALVLRAIEVYEKDRLDFADAYLVAAAERSGVAEVVSFDKAIDRVGTVQRVVPPERAGG